MYQRVILNLSGEALKGNGTYGIHPITVKGIATEIKEIYELGVQVGIVVGAGNLWRGKTGKSSVWIVLKPIIWGCWNNYEQFSSSDALESILVPSRVMLSCQSQLLQNPTFVVGQCVISRREEFSFLLEEQDHLSFQQIQQLHLELLHSMLILFLWLKMVLKGFMIKIQENIKMQPCLQNYRKNKSCNKS